MTTEETKTASAEAAAGAKPTKTAATPALMLAAVCAVLYIVFRFAVNVPVLSPLVRELALVWLVYAAFAFALGKLQARLAYLKDQRADGTYTEGAATAFAVLSSAAKYLAVIVTVLSLLRTAGVNTTTILAATGIVSLVVGFASQSLIEDVVTGIFILFEGQYKIGDVLVLDDFRGTVQNIGVRTTTLQDAGGNRLIVNNSDVRNVQNRSRAISRAVTTVAVSYAKDLDAQIKMLEEEVPKIKSEKGLFAEAPSFNGIEEFQDSGVLLHFSVKTKENDIFAARRELNLRIWKLLQQHGIEIPFPQVDVHNKD